MRKPTFHVAGFVLMILVCVCGTAAAIEPAGPFRGKFSEGFETQQDSFVTELPVFGGESTVRNLLGHYLHVSGCWWGLGVVCARSGDCFMGSVGGGVEWIFDLPAGRFGGYFTVLDLLPNTEGAIAYFYDVNDDLLAQADVNAPYSTWTWNGWVSDVPIKRIEIIGLGSSGWLDLGGFVMHDDMEYIPFGEPGTTHYVDDDATGANDGSSWEDAFIYLQDALAVAHYGDEILVAQGIYKPDQGAGVTAGDREATFQLVNGVSIKGGYAGSGEPAPNALDVETYETILTGDLYGNDIELENLEWNTIYLFVVHPSRAENSCHVVTGSGTDKTAVLDGVTITRGNAYGPEPGYCENKDGSLTCGAGMYNDSGSPTLTNCTFCRNTSWTIYAYSCPEDSFDAGIRDFDVSFDLTDIFMVDTSGAGIYNCNSNMTLNNCMFEENIVFGADSSSAGGGIHNVNSDIVLINCIFKTNVATGFDNDYWGGAIANSDSNPTLEGCSFIGNVAGYNGGAMTLGSATTASVTNCTFIGNRAISGGAICGLGQAALINCTFYKNKASGFGGGIYIGSSNPTLTNCMFSENSAGHRGGGMFNGYHSSSTLNECTFIGNTANYEGGGMYNEGSSPVLTNCTFSGNRTFFRKDSGFGGAGISNTSASPVLRNCVFTGNSCNSIGGGMFSYGSSPRLTNCTFAENIALKGNAMAFDSWEGGSPSEVEATNCIFWNGENGIQNSDNSVVTITYSDVRGGWPGEGNIDADACFVDPGYWDANGTPADANDDFWVGGDYHLRAGSPCIDAGTDAGVYEDIEGNVRPFDFPAIDNNGELADFDMGAYEAVAIEGELRILPRTVNRRSEDGQVIAVMQLPVSDSEDDIAADEPLVLLPGDIKAVEQKILPTGGGELSKLRIRAVFDKAKLLEAIPDNSETDVTIIGRLISGRHFYGTDTIRIISSQK